MIKNIKVIKMINMIIYVGGYGPVTESGGLAWWLSLEKGGGR